MRRLVGMVLLRFNELRRTRPDPASFYELRRTQLELIYGSMNIFKSIKKLAAPGEASNKMTNKYMIDYA